MKLVYGLGNPGNKYLLTRHNIGFMVADLLAQEYRISLKKRASGIVSGRGEIDGVAMMLAKPMTYMNLSGLPFHTLSLRPSDLIVIHDDMDLPFGQVRVKVRGGSGGHKGLVSIISELGDDGFVRVRCGIGRPIADMDPSDYVLERFREEEMEELAEEIARAADAVQVCLKSGAAKAMNAFNRREMGKDEDSNQVSDE